MRSVIITIVLFFVTITTHAVAISEVLVSSGELEFKNFTANTYNLSNHFITIGNNTYKVDSLPISSGSLSVAGGATIRFSGFSFKDNALATPNSSAPMSLAPRPGQ